MNVLIPGSFACAGCGEINETLVDPSQGARQSYVEDCQVCCRPWDVRVTYDENGFAAVTVDPEDDGGGPDDE